MEFENFTWKEAEEYIKKKRAIILPIGSVEEHGYHLPLSTDSSIALAIAKELSRRTGIAYLPLICYSVCVSTARYKGTITVKFESFLNYLKDILESIEQNGFEKVYIISGHLGSSHVAAIREACKRVNLRCYFLDMTKIKIDDIIESKPMHACEAETSLMLYFYENKVRKSKVVDEEFTKPKYLVSSLEKTDSGVFGKPSKASIEKGKKIFERMVSEFERVIKGEIE